MMKLKIVATIALVALFQQTFSQGCSDAGFCTMGAMKPDQAYNRDTNFKLRSIELSQYRGTTNPLSALIYVTNLDATFSIKEKTFVQLKLPYQAVTGNLGKTSGIGDISLSVTRQIKRTETYDINATLGTKIPTNSSDLTKENNEFGNLGSHLPMYYQVSLGSVDFIAGMSLLSKKWLVAVGYQNALTANNNKFRWSEWNGYPGGRPYIDQHGVGVELKRGTDVMFRLERNWRFPNFNFSLGALPIYRITHDEGKNIVGEYEKINDTTGLALSIITSFGYHFNVNSSVKFIYGFKLVDRDFNPDGLTRHNVITGAYVFRF